MKKVLGIYGADGGFEFLEEGIKFGTIGRADFDRFIDQSRFDLRRVFLAPLKSGQSLTIKPAPFDLIVNYIADIDVNAKTLAMAETICDTAKGTPVLNHPSAVARSQRHLVSAVLQGLDGLQVPKCDLAPAGSASDLLEFIDGLDGAYPLMVRPFGTQTGMGLNRFETFADIESHYAESIKEGLVLLPHYVTEYVEHRSPDGIYRKVRYFVVDGVGYPQHIYMSKEWPVHGASRSGLLLEREDLRNEERQFLDDHTAHQPEALDALFPLMRKRLDLDYFGVDVNFMEDGGTLLFEANAAMNMSSADHFPPGYGYIEPARTAIINAINELISRSVR